MQLNASDRCFRCRFLSRFFTQEARSLQKTRYGWCRQHAKVAFIQDTCELFQPKKSSRGGLWNIQICLNGILNEVSELRRRLEAEQDERAGQEQEDL